MTIVLILMLTNAALGGFDTLWYHEYRSRLPHQLQTTRTELRLHAARDATYVAIYGTLAFGVPTGLFAALFAALLTSEIIITLADFVVEDRDRPAIGGMPAGERVIHTVIAIVYGAMLAFLLPELWHNAGLAAGFATHGAAAELRWAMLASTAGIAATGARDTLALSGHAFDVAPQRSSSAG